LLEIFEDKSSLPTSTKLLIAISDFMVWYWYLIIWFFIAVFVWVSIWKQTPSWKYLFDKFLFKIPILWEVLQKIILSKFSRVFSNLISSWVSMVESLKITSEIVWNEVYRQKILLLAQDVKSGIRIHESLVWSKLFPDIMVQMIQVWEETANLDVTIIKVAEFYDEQVDNTIAVLNKLLEPFIIVFLAVTVWFISMAIMQPIMNLADTISQK
jgi:type II secretory pathway component PulF